MEVNSKVIATCKLQDSLSLQEDPPRTLSYLLGIDQSPTKVGRDWGTRVLGLQLSLSIDRWMQEPTQSIGILKLIRGQRFLEAPQQTMAWISWAWELVKAHSCRWLAIWPESVDTTRISPRRQPLKSTYLPMIQLLWWLRSETKLRLELMGSRIRIWGGEAGTRSHQL